MSTTSYPRNLSYAQWKLLEPLLPLPKPGGRPRFQSFREVSNAIFYLTSTGGAWRSLPHDFPNWNTVFGYFNSWKKTGIWEQVNQQLRESVREQEGSKPELYKVIIESLSVKTDCQS